MHARDFKEFPEGPPLGYVSHSESNKPHEHAVRKVRITDRTFKPLSVFQVCDETECRSVLSLVESGPIPLGLPLAEARGIETVSRRLRERICIG